MPLIIVAISSAIEWKETKNPKPFIESTLGILIAQESIIYHTSLELGNKTLKEQYADKYNVEYVTFKQTQLIESIGLFVLFFYLILKFFLGVMGFEGQDNSKDKLFTFLKGIFLTFIVLGIIEIAYFFLMYKEFFYPSQGLITFAKNFKEIFASGSILAFNKLYIRKRFKK